MSNADHDPRCHGLHPQTPAELRAGKLAALDAGDIVGATTRVGGNILPFLITRSDATHVHARAMTSQFPLQFDRGTGEATDIYGGETRRWRIVVMQPLPLEYHNLMLAVDRRMRLGSDGTTNPLDEGDRRVLLYLADHWAAFAI